MSELLEFKSDAGEVVLVEVAEPPRAGVMRGGRPAAAVVESGEDLEHVLGRLGPVIRGMVASVRSAADRPDEVEIEFSVKISADSNLIIARAGGEANFRIALRWAGTQGT